MTFIAKVAGEASKDMLDIAEKMDKAEGSASKLEARLIGVQKAMIAIHAASELGSAGLAPRGPLNTSQDCVSSL